MCGLKLEKQDKIAKCLNEEQHFDKPKHSNHMFKGGIVLTSFFFS